MDQKQRSTSESDALQPEGQDRLEDIIAEHDQTSTDAGIDQTEAYANDPANHRGFDTPTAARPTNPNRSINPPRQNRTTPTISRGQDSAIHRLPSDQDPSQDHGERAAAGRMGKFASAVQGVIQRNPRKIMGGGIVGIFIAILLVIMMPLLAEFKLSMMMENITSHGFRHVTHAYVERQALLIRYYLKTRLDPTFDPSKSIVNYERGPIKNLYGKLRGDRKLEEALERNGYKITYQRSLDDPYARILRIERVGSGIEPLEGHNFDRVYNLTFEGTEARAHMQSIAEEVLHGQGIMRRIQARRLMILTGTKLHWIDKHVAVPLDQIRTELRNQSIRFVLEHSSIARKAASQILALLTGSKVSAEDSARVSQEIGDEIAQRATTEIIDEQAIRKITTEVITKNLTKVIGDVSNPVGWVVLATYLGCLMNDGAKDAYDKLQQIAKDKATAEYIVVFAENISALSQMHNGNTDAETVNAFMEMLVDDKGNDFSQSNNYKRATGQNVPYTHSTDCKSGQELCDARRPNSVVDKTYIGMSLKGLKNIADSDLKYIPGAPGNIYSNGVCSVLMPVIQAIDDIVVYGLKFLTDAYISLFPDPVESFLRQMQKKGQEKTAAWFGDNIMLPIINWLVPPVVSGSTVGPHRANAAAAGALGSAGSFMRSICGDTAPGDSEAAKKCRLEGKDLADAEDAANQEAATRYAALSTWDRFASFASPRTFASRFVSALPTSPREVFAKTSRFTASIFSPQLIPSLVTGSQQLFSPAMAANYEEPTGTDVYSYTNNCISNAKLGDGSDSKCKGMDKFDNYVACSMLGGASQGENMPADCNEGLDPEGSSGTDNPGTSTPPATSCGDLKACAQSVLTSPNIAKTGRLVTADLQAAASGQPSSAGKPLSVHMLSALLELAKNYKFSIGAIESGGTGHAKNSNHYQGTAVDISARSAADYAGMFRQLHSNAAAYGIDELIFSPAPSGTSTLKHGKPFTYNGETLAGHRNHIHYSTEN